MSDTTTVRARLHKELDALLARHEVIGGHLRNENREMPDDWPDRASMLENDEVLEALDEKALSGIRALRQALARVDDGSYGVCATCGETIPEGRLEALPAASLCTGCAS